MITAYALQQNQLFTAVVAEGSPLPQGTVWLDLEQPTAAEIAMISQYLRIKIPTLRDVHEMGQAKQIISSKEGTFLHLPVIIGSSTETPRSGTLLLAILPQFMITLRVAESRAVKIFATQLAATPEILATAENAAVHFLQTLTQRLADLGEITAHELEQVSHLVFQESLQRAKALGQGNALSWRKVLIGLGRTARLNHRLMGALMGLDKALAFLRSAQEQMIDKKQDDLLAALQQDVRRVLEHANAMVNESNFLLDAIVGAISIEQNNVVKIFSMAAVILMPPTMIASIYGMNFVHMPELHWAYGYPLVVCLMLLSALLPWWWFKRNGWF